MFFLELLLEMVVASWFESSHNPPRLGESPIEREMKEFWQKVGVVLLGLGMIGYFLHQWWHEWR